MYDIEHLKGLAEIEKEIKFLYANQSSYEKKGLGTIVLDLILVMVELLEIRKMYPNRACPKCGAAAVIIGDFHVCPNCPSEHDVKINTCGEFVDTPGPEVIEGYQVMIEIPEPDEKGFCSKFCKLIKYTKSVENEFGSTCILKLGLNEFSIFKHSIIYNSWGKPGPGCPRFEDVSRETKED